MDHIVRPYHHLLFCAKSGTAVHQKRRRWAFAVQGRSFDWDYPDRAAGGKKRCSPPRRLARDRIDQSANRASTHRRFLLLRDNSRVKTSVACAAVGLLDTV